MTDLILAAVTFLFLTGWIPAALIVESLTKRRSRRFGDLRLTKRQRRGI